MVKKVSYILIVVAIVVAGFIGLKKLNYWERSVWIFKLDNKAQTFEGRGDRGGGDSFGRPGPGNPRGFEREGMREMPDSIRRQFASRGERSDMRNKNIPDSLRRNQFRRNYREQIEVAGFEREPRDGGGRGRGEFVGGKKIYLKNIYWFTAAFALFTLIMIYLDRACCFVFKRHDKQLQ
jgi:hypothetical protein